MLDFEKLVVGPTPVLCVYDLIIIRWLSATIIRWDSVKIAGDNQSTGHAINEDWKRTAVRFRKSWWLHSVILQSNTPGSYERPSLTILPTAKPNHCFRNVTNTTLSGNRKYLEWLVAYQFIRMATVCKGRVDNECFLEWLIYIVNGGREEDRR